MRAVRAGAAALAAGLAAAALLALGAPGAGAAEATLTLRQVDTTEYPKVTLSALSTGPRPDLADFTVRENGRFVRDIDVVPVSETATPVGIVLVVDTSGSMKANDAMGQARAAAKQFVARRGPNERIALVAFSSTPRIVRPFTTDTDLLLADIESLAADGETSLWDGVSTAVNLFRDEPGLQANIVVLSDGKDTTSTSTQAEATSGAKAVGAAAFVVGLQGGDFEEGPARALAEETGGAYLTTTDPRALGGLYGQVQSTLQNQFEVTFTSEAGGGPLELALTAGSGQARAQANPGTVSKGVNTNPRLIEPAGGPLRGVDGKLVGIGVGAIAAVLGGFALASLVLGPKESELSSALRPYTDPALAGAEGGDGPGGSARPAFLQRAVDATETFAENRGILARTERLLEEADLALRASEALLLYAAGALVAAVAGGLLGRSPLTGLAGLLLGSLLPPAVLKFLAGRRKKHFLAQLPDTLQLLAGSLRAGYSLMQGVDTVSQEVDGPMGRELRRIVTEARLGRPLEEAMDDAAERVGSPDFSWAVMAIRIQREVGGNLAELLLTVADTMVERERLRREVKALTAEGRMSAIVLGLLPPGLGAAMYVMNRDYVTVLFRDSQGRIMLGGAIVMIVGGFYWMKKMIEVDA